jgi:hypothetical protein
MLYWDASAERKKHPMTATVHENAAKISIEDRVHGLIDGINDHPAFNNEFYKAWMGGPVSADQVEVFARNFYERAQHGPRYIALAFLQMDNIKIMAETAENLFEEMGYGDHEKAHSVLLRGFLEELLTRIRGYSVKFEDISAPVLASTRRLVDEGDAVFKSMSADEVRGALLAKEWHAYLQLVYIYEGVRNYMDLFTAEEFHENCEYFYLHIGATEKRHKYDSLEAAAKTCETEQQLADLTRGFYAYLDLLAVNWQEISEAMRRA